MDVELIDMSHYNDPPPAYTERASGQANDPPRDAGIDWLCGLLYRDDCGNPRSRNFPGACMLCTVKLFVCLLLYLIILYVTISAIAMLSRGAAWKEVLIIVITAAFFLMCIKLSFAVTEALARICRIGQPVCMVMASLLTEIFNKSGVTDPLGNSETHGPILIPQIVILIFTCLSIVCGVLIVAYLLDCFWHGPKQFLVAVLITSVGCFALAIICIMVLPAWGLRHSMTSCAILCVVCPWANPGKTATKTCSFKHMRYMCVGYLAQLGQAREPSNPTGGRRRTEDEIPCTSVIISCLMTLLIVILMILAIPVVCGWIRMRIEMDQRESYLQLLSVSAAGVMVGMGIGFALPAPPVHSAPLCSPTKCAVALLISLVVLLVIFAVPCALILQCIAAGVMFSLAVALLRKIGKTEFLLPMAIIIRALLALLLIALSMTAGMAFLLDTNWVLRW